MHTANARIKYQLSVVADHGTTLVNVMYDDKQKLIEYLKLQAPQAYEIFESFDLFEHGFPGGFECQITIPFIELVTVRVMSFTRELNRENH